MPRVARICRAEVLDLLGRGPAAISVHEHVGRERFVHADGRVVEHCQTMAEWAEHARALRQAGIVPENGWLAAAFFAMPIYEVFRGREGVREGEDLYRQRNHDVLAQARRFSAEAWHGRSPPAFVPLPFLIVDPTVPAAKLDELYADDWDDVYGLKWHPFAQNCDIERYVAAGYLELAARRTLPTVVHCARPGVDGDFDTLRRRLFSAAERAGARIDVAHAAFLHPDLSPGTLPRHCWVDTGPWNMICDFARPGTSFADRAELLAALFERLGDQSLMGLDTPWSRVTFPGGVEYGSSARADIGVLAHALHLVGADRARHVLHDNPMRFLHGTPCRSDA